MPYVWNDSGVGDDNRNDSCSVCFRVNHSPSKRKDVVTSHQHQATRRGFLRQSVVTGTAFALPTIVPGHVLGRDGAVAPSEQELRSA